MTFGLAQSDHLKRFLLEANTACDNFAYIYRAYIGWPNQDNLFANALQCEIKLDVATQLTTLIVENDSNNVIAYLLIKALRKMFKWPFK